MPERIVRRLSLVLSLIVATGFVLFAVDDFGRASDRSRSRLGGQPDAIDPTPRDERARERAHGAVHEVIDDANDVLLRPFTGIAASSASRWVRRGVPALLGLLVYGVLLSFAARYTKARS